MLIAACGKRSESPLPAPASGPARARTTALSQPAQAQIASPIALSTPAGERVVEVSMQGSDLTVAYGGEVFHGRLKGEKRKYESVEVKFGDDGGFKVRTLDGKLLWKVKATPEKVKVSDNEENKNPYELKLKEGKVKVYAPGERFLGQVKSRTDHLEVEDAGGAEKYRGTSTRAEAFYGVALLEAIPTRERAVIFAELAVRR